MYNITRQYNKTLLIENAHIILNPCTLCAVHCSTEIHTVLSWSLEIGRVIKYKFEISVIYRHSGIRDSLNIRNYELDNDANIECCDTGQFLIALPKQCTLFTSKIIRVDTAVILII